VLASLEADEENAFSVSSANSGNVVLVNGNIVIFLHKSSGLSAISIGKLICSYHSKYIVMKKTLLEREHTIPYSCQQSYKEIRCREGRSHADQTISVSLRIY
jgi:hypothetical protein